MKTIHVKGYDKRAKKLRTRQYTEGNDRMPPRKNCRQCKNQLVYIRGKIDMFGQKLYFDSFDPKGEYYLCIQCTNRINQK